MRTVFKKMRTLARVRILVPGLHKSRRENYDWALSYGSCRNKWTLSRKPALNSVNVFGNVLIIPDVGISYNWIIECAMFVQTNFVDVNN